VAKANNKKGKEDQSNGFIKAGIIGLVIGLVIPLFYFFLAQPPSIFPEWFWDIFGDTLGFSLMLGSYSCDLIKKHTFGCWIGYTITISIVTYLTIGILIYKLYLFVKKK